MRSGIREVKQVVNPSWFLALPRQISVQITAVLGIEDFEKLLKKSQESLNSSRNGSNSFHSSRHQPKCLISTFQSPT